METRLRSWDGLLIWKHLSYWRQNFTDMSSSSWKRFWLCNNLKSISLLKLSYEESKNCFVIVRYQCWWWKHFSSIRRKLHLWLIFFLNSYYCPVTMQSDTTLTYIILISLWPNQISHLKVFALGKIRLFYPLLSSLSYAHILAFFKIIIWTMAVLTYISTMAAVTHFSAVEI